MPPPISGDGRQETGGKSQELDGGLCDNLGNTSLKFWLTHVRLCDTHKEQGR